MCEYRSKYVDMKDTHKHNVFLTVHHELTIH